MSSPVPIPAHQAFESARPVNALTVDVEDYFQVSAFESRVDRHDWRQWPLRVRANTDRLLELFAGHGARATFFTLGWIAEREPELVHDIVAAGHEIASHGWAHHRVTSQDRSAFRDDVRRTRALLEDVSGKPVVGYRAASYSVSSDTLWALDILAEEGYRYSSSICPVRHDHYGIPGFPRFAFRLRPGGLLEIPVTTTVVAGRNWACGGGGWFRLLPYAVSRWALRRVNAERQPAVFYLHPWEIDPAQPRIDGVGARARFRHYLNLGRTEARLHRLLEDFSWQRMDTVFGLQGAAAHESRCA